MKQHIYPLCLSLTVLASLQPSFAGAASETLDLSLEELMQVVVTSVSKRAQTLAETAAAVHVIQAEDIRRSGASSIPEALRLAPGVQVAAIGNNKWAVSIRGQADRFTNKLLVLVDGRSVYTPLFSGTLWETLDIPLENIARIEVIRGPGASVWGANAVNGVINIITLSPFDTLGGKVAVAAGSELRGKGLARYGWSPDPDTAVQLYAHAHDYGTSQPVSGAGGVDTWRNQSAGFKLEHLLQDGVLRLQGGVYHSRAGDQQTLLSASPTLGPTITPIFTAMDVSGGHVMARWERQADSLQVYLEHSSLDYAGLAEQRSTVDMEYQNRQVYGDKHDLTWGLGYRYNIDRIDSSPMLQAPERKRTTDLFSAYLQDEITLQPERWRLSLGARLERNDYTGFELQPNARLLWTPDNSNSAWLSLARAIRTPSRIEQGGSAYVAVNRSDLPTPNAVQLVSRNLREEQLTGLDLGWRHQFNPNTSLDLTAFHYQYDGLRGGMVVAAPTLVLPAGYLLLQTQENNANSARTNGIEVALDWRPRPDWRLQTSYSWLDLKVSTANLPGQTPSDYIGTSPTHQFSLRSSHDLSSKLHWDAWLRYVSRIDTHAIPAYTTLDMRLAWQPSKMLELSLVGQNLLNSAHPEYGSLFIQSAPSEIQRGVYVNLDWKF